MIHSRIGAHFYIIPLPCHPYECDNQDHAKTNQLEVGILLTVAMYIKLRSGGIERLKDRSAWNANNFLKFPQS